MLGNVVVVLLSVVAVMSPHPSLGANVAPRTEQSSDVLTLLNGGTTMFHGCADAVRKGFSHGRDALEKMKPHMTPENNDWCKNTMADGEKMFEYEMAKWGPTANKTMTVMESWHNDCTMVHEGALEAVCTNHEIVFAGLFKPMWEENKPKIKETAQQLESMVKSFAKEVAGMFTMFENHIAKKDRDQCMKDMSAAVDNMGSALTVAGIDLMILYDQWCQYAPAFLAKLDEKMTPEMVKSTQDFAEFSHRYDWCWRPNDP